MAIKQLTDEQVRTMTVAEKDKWWFENVWRGNMPQLNLRSGVTGFLLGGTLSLTNIYIGLKTGWSLGVGITAVILSFAAWKILSKISLGKEMTILENNAMQSMAVAAGYACGPLVASIPAYMMVTGKVIPMMHVLTWMIPAMILGVLVAFPLKRRFINDEQYPFPEGKACGIVLDGLHSDDEAEGKGRVKLLTGFGLLGVIWTIIRSEKIMGLIRLPFYLPAYLEEFIYKYATPAIMATPLKSLTIRFDTDIVMMAAGGLMGFRPAVSLLIGAVINYCILAPIMISKGIITPNEAGVIGFRQITMWSLWGGVAMMTTASLYSFFAKPKILLDSFSGIFSKKRNSGSDMLKDIELPMWVFVAGIPIVGLIVVALTHYYFGVGWIMGIIAVPLAFVFGVIAAHSTALTSITPTGAMGKLTQLTYAVLAPRNIGTNLMTAAITSEVAGNASNLLMDIKPGYMLGAKPRHQAMGHVIGIIAGSIFCVPVFYWILGGNIGLFGSEQMPVPAAQVWRGVAEILTQGLSFLHPTARWAILIGGILGIVFELLKNVTKGRFPLSAVAVGVAFVIPFFTCLSFFLGAFIFWLAGLLVKNEKGWVRRVMLPGQETICAGLIAGGAIMGIIAILIEI